MKKHAYCLTLGLLVLLQANLLAQRLQPTHQDLAYDQQHAAQKLDVYLADSEKELPAMIYIHGGGWRAGSKNSVPAWLTSLVRDKVAHVVSVEYRFTDVAPHPAQTNDCLRAIQFARAHAEEWKIDTSRIGVTGGSAGGHLSLYVALHDDVAQPDSGDPVQQQSSRVACAVSFAGPTDWGLLDEIDHAHPAYRQLVGYQPGTPLKEMDAAKIEDVSPISFVSKDDPPIMQVHGDADVVVPVQHARRLEARLKEFGITSELVEIKGGNHGVSGAGPNFSMQATKFVHQAFSNN